MASRYEYARGDLLEQRNTYFYTTYEGPAFLDSWRRCRDDALSGLPSPPAAPAAVAAVEPLPPRGGKTAVLLGAIKSALESGNTPPDSLDRLVQRFEVTKRVHGAYGAEWRAVDREDYRDLGRYLSFAEVLDLAYARTSSLVYLNGLLKVLDTLVALRRHLEVPEAARLAGLLLAERGHVERLREGLR